MAGVSRFEELLAWRKARVLTREIYRVTRRPGFRQDFGLASQTQRCAVSAMANIAEGFARKSPTEFRRFLDIAFGSTVELTSHLYVALDVEYLDEAEFRQLRTLTDEVARLILALKRGTLDAPARPARTTHDVLRTGTDVSGAGGDA